MEKVDLSSFLPAEAPANAKGAGIASISIVNTSDNGKRINLSKTALEILGNPKSIQIGLSEDSLIIATNLPDQNTFYKISKSCIYNSTLILEITKKFQLDFSSGRTSILFSDVTTVSFTDGSKALIFKLR